MRSSLPPTSFNSPRLIRLLASLAGEDVAASKQSSPSFAERLGHWLDLNDAIALSGALAASAPSAGSAADARARAAATETAAGTVAGSLAGSLVDSLREDLARVRAALADSILSDGVFRSGKARIKLPVPAVPAAAGGSAGAARESNGSNAANPANAAAETPDFEPYRRYYAAHQRDMESSIGLLRTRLRRALADAASGSSGSPALARLAVLDEVMERALGERERSLLASVPQLLAKRFARLRQAHRQALADQPLANDPPADDPAQWMQPGGWLATFCREQQAVLLAELEVRLQPAAGLVDAFDNEPNAPGMRPRRQAGAGRGRASSVER